MLSHQIDFRFTPEQLATEIHRIAQPSPRWYPYSYPHLDPGKMFFINNQLGQSFFHGGTLFTYKTRIFLEVKPMETGARVSIRARNVEWLFPFIAGVVWFFLGTLLLILHPQFEALFIMLVLSLFGGMFFVFALVGLILSRRFLAQVEIALREIAAQKESPS